MLARAADLQGKRSELLVAESLLVIHDASEMVMQIVYEHHNIVPPRDFLGFWPKLSDAHLPTPPFYAEMRRLNDLRVGFKHRGTVPNPSTVRALDADVRGFCAAVCSQYLDTQFGEITLADLLEDEVARGHLKSAELLYSQDNVAEALVEIDEAFHAIWQSAEENGCIFVHKIPIGGGNLPANALTTWEPKLIRSFNILLLGVDLPTYSLFCSLTPSISRSPYNNSKQVQWWHEPHATPEQFSTLLTFVIDVGLTVQQRSREPIV